MFLKQSFVLRFCLFLGVSLVSATKLHFAIRPNSHIVELQEESRELAATHAEVSGKCFAIYSPILSKVVEDFQVNYGACISAFDNGTAVVNEKYSDDRQSILRSANIGCSYPNANCQVWTSEAQDLNVVISRLECASSNSGESAKLFYAISANATEIAAKIQEEYRLLTSKREICLNDANRSYVEDTADTYEELNACLEGRISAANTTTTCQTIAPTNTTTAAPTTKNN
ncbi:uncharacterized protein LOC108088365 [Drosophila ficusphila]|uniref:uncharacterized protein LOC108088365 n=1 Tax=Drosophila ficusphila TaxID=30025 RepID=UPI0007E774ED|nr:uncharacterized protein LOC108088365 [Drosophila ficusphila]